MIEIIQEKRRQYRATNAVEEENATKEIIQEIALYAFWRSDFFDVAFFQGGTSQRILHRLPRFFEDLGFMLRSPCMMVTPMVSWPMTQCMPIIELRRAQGTPASKTNAPSDLTPHEITLIGPAAALLDRQRLPASTIPKPFYP